MTITCASVRQKVLLWVVRTCVRSTYVPPYCKVVVVVIVIEVYVRSSKSYVVGVSIRTYVSAYVRTKSSSYLLVRSSHGSVIVYYTS